MTSYRHPFFARLAGFFLALAAALSWAGAPPVSTSAQADTIRVGVLAFRPKPETALRWQPLVDYLNQTIPDRRFALAVYHLEELERAAAQGQVDFILTQPSHYVLLTYRNGMTSPLASLVNKEGAFGVSKFGGVIVTRAERDDIASLADLRGKTLAAPALNSLGAYQMQAFELLRAGVELPGDATVLETGQPQDKAIEAVLAGRADAGFARTGVIESMLAKGKLDVSQIKLIGAQRQPDFPFLVSTRLYPEWPFAAMPGVKPDLARQVAAALLSLPHEGELAQRMSISGFTIPGDYRSIDEVLRTLRLPPFDAPPTFTFSDVYQRFQPRIAAIVLMVTGLLALGMISLMLLNRRLRDQRNRVASSEARQKALFHALGEGVLGCDLDARCTFINQKALLMLGRTEDDCLGRDLHQLIHGDQAAPAAPGGESLRSALLSQHTLQGEEMLHRKDGSAFPAAFVVTPLSEKGVTTGSVVALSDITARIEAEARIHHLAFHDDLTGLPNRGMLIERISQALAGSAPGRQDHALMLLNIDRFKIINNARGSDTGDALLKAIGSRLGGLLSDKQCLARIGADEFAILLPHLEAVDQPAAYHATLIEERLHASLKAPFHIKGETFSISTSLGATLFPNAMADTPDGILMCADTALRRAKLAGGNQTAFFEPGMIESAEQRFRVERELRHAVSHGELRLFLQPQVSPDGRLAGAEALVRWLHPTRGLLLPGQFIPCAEESDLIVELGGWVLSEASQIMARADINGLPLRLSVNISARHFRQSGFVPWVRDLMAASGAHPERLTLEITESLVIDNLNDVVSRMNELAALGIRLSIDDFGTGYSSLAYLKRLPIHEVKIDKTFVQDAPVDDNDAALVETILAIADRMRLDVVAEGIETADQSTFLEHRGRMVQQGYLLGRPADAETWLSQWRASTLARDWTAP